jgi:hypothetical protein
VISNTTPGNAPLKTPTELGMSAYAWANAREGMQQAMALAHWASRTASTVSGKFHRAAHRHTASREELALSRGASRHRWVVRGDLVE